MRISTRGRYGLRAMLELAQGFGEGPMLMSTIAERQGLSRKHLHNLLTSLKSAGLVRSVRGPGGGFELTAPPENTKLSEVLRTLEGPLSLVDCVEDTKACDRVGRCVTRGVWEKLSRAIEEILDNVTLQELVNPQTKACHDHGDNKGKRGPRRRTPVAGKRTGGAHRKPGRKARKK